MVSAAVLPPPQAHGAAEPDVGKKESRIESFADAFARQGIPVDAVNKSAFPNSPYPVGVVEMTIYDQIMCRGGYRNYLYTSGVCYSYNGKSWVFSCGPHLTEIDFESNGCAGAPRYFNFNYGTCYGRAYYQCMG